MHHSSYRKQDESPFLLSQRTGYSAVAPTPLQKSAGMFAMGRDMSVSECVEVRDYLGESALSCHMDPENRTQVVWLDGQRLYLLCYFGGSPVLVNSPVWGRNIQILVVCLNVLVRVLDPLEIEL